jgi:cobalt/nickel transport system permease protein
MTHLHIPDGVLPVWLWLSGAGIAAILIIIAARRMSRPPFARKLPLLSMTAAFMIVVMSLPIVPGGYDMQLAAVGGIILGPAAAVIAAFIINLLLALIGHGGITVGGLNTIIMSSEMAAGWALFRIFRRVLSPGLAGGAATFLAMAIGAGVMIGIVSAGLAGVGEVPLEHIMVVGPAHDHAAHVARTAESASLRNLSISRFAVLVVVVGSFGWLLESIMSAIIVRFAARVKPDLVGLAPTHESV